MGIRYKFRILPELKKAGYSSNRIRKDKIMGERAIQQLREDKHVSWAILEKICQMLNCQPGDFLEYVEDDTEDTQDDEEGAED